MTPLRRRRSAVPAPAPFVVGVGRSGTTLLRLMLDAHPELAIPPETHFAPGLIERAHEGAGADALVDEIVGTRAWADFGIQAERLRERVTALGEGGAATVLRAFYGLCAEREGKPRWGDKTPIYVRRRPGRRPGAFAAGTSSCAMRTWSPGRSRSCGASAS